MDHDLGYFSSNYSFVLENFHCLEHLSPLAVDQINWTLLHLIAAGIEFGGCGCQGLPGPGQRLLYELVALGDHEVTFSLSTLTGTIRDEATLVVEGTDLCSSSPRNPRGVATLGLKLAPSQHSLLNIISKSSFALVLRLRQALVQSLLVVIQLGLNSDK